jgi:hypothetical protein
VKVDPEFVVNPKYEVPPTNPVVAEIQNTDIRLDAVPKFLLVQVVPPLVVKRTTPLSPTAQTSVELFAQTDLRAVVTPEVCAEKETPSFEDLKIPPARLVTQIVVEFAVKRSARKSKNILDLFIEIFGFSTNCGNTILSS